jgi:hypothetical protein
MIAGLSCRVLCLGGIRELVPGALKVHIGFSKCLEPRSGTRICKAEKWSELDKTAHHRIQAVSIFRNNPARDTRRLLVAYGSTGSGWESRLHSVVTKPFLHELLMPHGRTGSD